MKNRRWPTAHGSENAMTIARKLELLCGTATALLGIIVALMMIRTDYETAQRLEEESHLLKGLIASLMIYIAPSSLVLIGAYLHAVMREPWGRAMILAGGAFSTSVFVLLLLVLALSGVNLRFWLNFLLPVFAMATLIVSLFVRK